MKMRCAVCSSWIANVDFDELRVPFTPEMFKPINPSCSLPWHPSLKQHEWLCPVCRKKPITDVICLDIGIKPVSEIKEQFTQEFVEVVQHQVEEEIQAMEEPVFLEPEDIYVSDDAQWFTCEVCGKMFDSKRKLNGHRRFAHERGKGR